MAVDRLLVVGFVSANGQNVVYSQKIQLDDRVFGLFPGKPAAKEVRNRIDVVAVLDDPADADGARPFLADPAPDRAVPVLFVIGLGSMTGDVYERRFVRHDLLDDVENLLSALPARRRYDLVAEQRSVGSIEVLRHMHIASILGPDVCD